MERVMYGILRLIILFILLLTVTNTLGLMALIYWYAYNNYPPFRNFWQWCISF
jgi:hypothetical protein